MILIGNCVVSSNSKKEFDDLLVLSIEKNDDICGYIYIYSVSRGELEKISKFSGYDPKWVNNKGKIVFSTDRDYDPYEIGDPPYNPDIYIIRRDGTNEERLTNNKNSYGHIVCKYNDHIIYIEEINNEEGKFKKIYSMDLNGGKIKEIFITKLDITNLDISPDGKEIVFSTYDGIYKHNIDSSKQKELQIAEKIGIYYGSPKYSPDGKEILYFKGNGTFTKMSICIMDKNGQKNREIVSNMAFYEAVWSPDGGRIIFITEGESGGNKLYMINKDGTGLKEIKLPLDKPYKIYGIDW